MNQKSQSSGFRAEIANLKLPAVGKICFSLLADQRSWGLNVSVVWGRMKRGVGKKERGKVGRKFRANKRVKGPFRENAERNLFSPSDLKKFLSSVDQPLFPAWGGYSPLYHLLCLLHDLLLI